MISVFLIVFVLPDNGKKPYPIPSRRILPEMFTIYLFHFQEIRKWKGGGGNADSKAERVNRHDGDQLTGWKKGHWKKGIRISGKGSFPEKEKKKGTATLLFIYDEHL